MLKTSIDLLAMEVLSMAEEKLLLQDDDGDDNDDSDNEDWSDED